MQPALQALTVETAFAPLVVRDREMALCCLAGLWLYHDFLDEAHKRAQEIETASGSFWHAIMHRREPDPNNSKYWWRRVGNHPVLKTLSERAAGLRFEFTTPFAFVDLVERVRGTGSDLETLARQVQQVEWELLFDHCYRSAI